MIAQEEKFNGVITVASRIIDYLSSGLYKDPASCLKELINNSFDADASRVEVFVKPDANRIIIEDDGEGMNKDEFLLHFSRISESHKRDRSDRTKGGRPKIGKIGIGFIAANEICDEMEIFSTKRGSSELLHVKIDFKEMREPLEKRRRDKTDFAKADYEGEILQAGLNDHYTRIFLQSVRGAAKEILASAKPQHEGEKTLSLYGLGPESVAEILKSTNFTSWKDFDPYSETILKVALNVPVRYAKDWMPQKHRHAVKKFEEHVAQLGFSVFYDGTELRKPIVFSEHGGETLLESFKYVGKEISAIGYFYVQHKTIKPIELHGLLARTRNAAIGEYDPQFWGFSPSEAPLIQRWVSAEIWADDRLEDAMNIDRRTLRDVHPSYVELRHAIHAHLRQVLKLARQKIYESGSAKRKRDVAKKAARDFQVFIDSAVSQTSPAAAHELEKSWRRLSARDQHRILIEKYSVIELYEAVLDVAKELLTPSQLTKFIKLLMERLRR